MNDDCTHPKGFASGCCFEPACQNFLYKEEENDQ